MLIHGNPNCFCHGNHHQVLEHASMVKSFFNLNSNLPGKVFYDEKIMWSRISCRDTKSLFSMLILGRNISNELELRFYANEFFADTFFKSSLQEDVDNLMINRRGVVCSRGFLILEQLKPGTSIFLEDTLNPIRLREGTLFHYTRKEELL